MSVVDDIKSRLDIVDYIQQVVPLKKAGRTYKACCPFHSEKTPSFSVNPDTQTWRCFGACAEGGDIFTFAMKQHGWTFSEAVEALGRQAGVEVRKQTPQQREHGVHLDKLRGLLQSAAELYHHQLTAAHTEDSRAVLAYAREKRGLEETTLSRFQIGYAPPGWQNMLHELLRLGYSEADVLEAGIATRSEEGRVYDRFRNRLMIPIRDERGRVIGFGARALDPNDNPKYLNSPQTPLFDKSRVLFGLDMAKKAITEGGVVVIVEGYMDAIQAHQAGFGNVVAQMGTAMTEAQITMLAPRYASKIILALDSDAAGQSATRRSLETARQALTGDYTGRLSVDIRILNIPDAKDPDDLIRESPGRWRTLIDAALPVADYVIQSEVAALPPHATVQEREALARRVLPMLTASENNLYQRDNIQKLSLRLRIPERELMQWASEQPAPRPQERTRRGGAPDVPATDGWDDGPPPLDVSRLIPPDDPEGPDSPDLPRLPAEPVPPRRALPPTPEMNERAKRLQAESLLEAYCLRLLFIEPDLYYQINRKFRTLAGEDAALRGGPLQEFGADDFNRGDYRALMTAFVLALKQTELDPLDYIRETLDGMLVQEVNTLLLDEAESVHDKLGRRFQGDFAHVVWKNYQRRTQPMVNTAAQLIDNALRLRRERLKREIDEFSFMQRDAQEDDNWAAALALGAQIAPSYRARDLLDAELNRNTTSLT